MGVDLSITHAVGVVLDQAGIERVRAQFDEDRADTYYAEGILEWVQESGRYVGDIEHGVAGSYYNSDPLTEYLYFPRLSEHYSEYDIPGGIVSGPLDVTVGRDGEISWEEFNHICGLAQLLGTPNPVVKGFTAVLWH